MAYSGPILTFQVSSNSLINSVVGGLVNNAAGAAVNVALSTELGQQVTSFLGLGVAEAPQNIISTILSPGLISTGSQTLTDALTGSILKSQALGPAGPLVAGLATQVVGGLANQLIGNLLPTSAPNPTKYFPGMGDEEDANYGGTEGPSGAIRGGVYTSGLTGGDVVFSIKPAQNTASAQAQGEVTGDSPGGVAEAMGFNTQFSTDISGFNIDSGQYLSDSMSIAFNSPGSFPNLASSTALAPALNSATTTFPISASLSTNAGPRTTRMALMMSGSPQGPGRVSTSASSSGYSPLATTIGERTIETFLSGTPSSESPASFASVFTDPSSPGSLALAGQFLEGEALSEGAIAIGAAAGAAFTRDLEAAEAQKKALEGWKFTTTPGDISWETAAKVDRAAIFGTNKPPVISGSRGMRDLSLSNALIEGFTFGKSVESKIASLESLLDYTLTNTYVKVPVYWVTASDKKYGDGNGDGGYFVIKQVKVKEELRDLSGKTTRAIVDVSFAQVPAYQVDDGRDLASKQVAGGKSILGAVSDQVDKFQKEQVARAQAQAAANPATLAEQARQAAANAEAEARRARELADRARRLAGGTPSTSTPASPTP